jgi:hypothetical protein
MEINLVIHYCNILDMLIVDSYRSQATHQKLPIGINLSPG